MPVVITKPACARSRKNEAARSQAKNEGTLWSHKNKNFRTPSSCSRMPLKSFFNANTRTSKTPRHTAFVHRLPLFRLVCSRLPASVCPLNHFYSSARSHYRRREPVAGSIPTRAWQRRSTSPKTQPTPATGAASKSKYINVPWFRY